MRPADLAAPAIALVRRWLDESKDVAPDPAAERLAGVLDDPNGLAFTVGFVDGVARPEDVAVAAKNLQSLTGTVPAFLPWYLKSAVSAGGAFGEVIPGVVVPAARRVLRQMVGHLVVDATPAKLGPAIEKLRADGSRLNLNLLGEAVLGSAEARRRLEGAKQLLARDDVDYVSVKVSSVASDLSMWAFDETVERVAETLMPLYRVALPGSKFINLDMEEYRDLDLTIAVFMRILDREELLGYTGGIVLQAYLPDALAAMQRLQAWAVARRERGGAPIKVRVVKGANLAMEHVDAALHGWPQATYDTKVDTDTNYKRVLDWALTPERTDAVQIGVAGHNLFDIALAWLLAKHRGVTEHIDFEMLLGMATGQAAAVSREVGQLLLYTPVVHPKEFDVAISYLVRRLEENASDQNFMSSVFEIAGSDSAFEREKNRFLASVDMLAAPGGENDEPSPNRTQNRADVSTLARASGFTNTPDTDPSLAANRAWGRRILSLVNPQNTLGVDTIAAAHIEDALALDIVVEKAHAASAEWGARTGVERAAVLRRAALSLEANRDRLIEVMAAETGKTIAEGDPEVSEAIDFANYYAEGAEDLDRIEGARFTPSRLTVVTPPWNFPVAIPAGSMLAALAAGSAVVIKPAPQARRSAGVLLEALWESGIPRDLLALVDIEEGALGRQLVSHELVDRVILTGAYETAKLFRSWRRELPLLAETSGKNAIVVTPSADLDLAVADIVKSAFGHAGQKCSAASLVILVGSVARSERFHRQLVDAVSSLRVGYASDPLTEMGPLIEPASGKLLDAFSVLGEGEKWLVEPVRRSSDGRLWTPGVREGVQPSSTFHTTEYFGPVLGIMHATSLEHAIELQNGTDYGLTAGLHSLDEAEIEQWLATVEAGNLYVNRGITGAIVERQPFGGWKRSAVGAGAKAGGPNYLMHLGTWATDAGEPSQNLSNAGFDGRVGALLDSAQPGLDWTHFDIARRGAKSDAVAWAGHFAPVDRSALGVERNILRYRPVPTTVRLSENARLHELLRVLSAATLVRSKVTVSSAHKLPRPMRALLKEWGVKVFIEDDATWLTRVTAAEVATPRIRLIGGSAIALAEALGDEPDVAVYAGEVTRAGRVELLSFVREQAISMTNHRFGNPTSLAEGLL
nr:bifunctional proline dehydrogenase/L-glutamate gamma-semialdehyde dehydrogenase [Agreia sp. COWG]